MRVQSPSYTPDGVYGVIVALVVVVHTDSERNRIDTPSLLDGVCSLTVRATGCEPVRCGCNSHRTPLRAMLFAAGNCNWLSPTTPYLEGTQISDFCRCLLNIRTVKGTEGATPFPSAKWA